MLVWEKQFFPLQRKPFLITQCNCTSIGSCSTKIQTNGFAAASQISSLQQRRPFLADSSLTPRSAVEMPQQPDWTSCSSQIADFVDPLPPSDVDLRASLKEQISARRCCKCRTIIVRRAGFSCTLMTLTLRACHTEGNPTLTLTAFIESSVLPLCARG